VKKLVSDPAMSLSTHDKREVCALHGWVGRRIFQQDRHDLCEAPPDPPEVNDLEEANGVEDDEDDEDEEAVEMRGSRSSSRRRGIPPKKTLAVRRITQVELAAGRAELQALGGDEPYARPKIRGDCQWCSVCQLVRDGTPQGVPLVCGHQITEVLFRSRPCVFAACKFSLYLDVSETGSIILNFPHLEPGQMPADRSCSLDLSDRGSMTLEEVAVVTNLTRERIRQVELKALIRRARPTAIAMGLGAEDAAAIGGSYRVGPSADLEETGVEGTVPSDISTIDG
jgi:hypothetical protein